MTKIVGPKIEVSYNEETGEFTVVSEKAWVYEVYEEAGQEHLVNMFYNAGETVDEETVAMWRETAENEIKVTTK